VLIAHCTAGFEYWSNPSQRDEGFITWQADGAQTARMGASALPADDATGISRRLISEEPMAIVMNLGVSREILFLRCQVDWLMLYR
jgi:hypothetical protein